MTMCFNYIKLIKSTHEYIGTKSILSWYMNK